MRQFPPSPALADTVSHITVLEVDGLAGEVSIPLVAKAAPSIVYQCSGGGAGSGGGEASLVLYGQNIQPFVFQASGHLLMIAFFLRPHRLAALFDFRASEVTDLCLDLAFLPEVRGSGLLERLAAAARLGERPGTVAALDERLRLMQGFITNLCAASSGGVNDTAGYAIGVIRAANGLISLRKLQTELRVTERSFQRLFDLHVGVSPKQFSRICQFQPAFQQLSMGRFDRLSDIAYDNGYADQSHLIRVFREFTGFTPGEYLTRTAAFLAAVRG